MIPNFFPHRPGRLKPGPSLAPDSAAPPADDGASPRRILLPTLKQSRLLVAQCWNHEILDLFRCSCEVFRAATSSRPLPFASLESPPPAHPPPCLQVRCLLLYSRAAAHKSGNSLLNQKFDSLQFFPQTAGPSSSRARRASARARCTRCSLRATQTSLPFRCAAPPPLPSLTCPPRRLRFAIRLLRRH